MIRGTPYGFENDVVEEDGWAMWKTTCPECGKSEDGDGEKLFALQCPSCERPGCAECMPLGRDCAYPDCEDA